MATISIRANIFEMKRPRHFLGHHCHDIIKKSINKYAHVKHQLAEGLNRLCMS